MGHESNGDEILYNGISGDQLKIDNDFKYKISSLLNLNLMILLMASSMPEST